MIRAARPADYDRIMAIARRTQFKEGLEAKEQERRGFIFRLPSKESLNLAGRRKGILTMVHAEQGKVCAVLLGQVKGKGERRMLPEKYQHVQWTERREFFEKLLDDEICCFPHYILKDPETKGNHALELEMKFLKQCHSRGIRHAFGTVSLQPYNRISDLFHRRMGWKYFGQSAETIDGRQVIWRVGYMDLDAKFSKA